MLNGICQKRGSHLAVEFLLVRKNRGQTPSLVKRYSTEGLTPKQSENIGMPNFKLVYS
jgi:hypothetical protein